MTNGAISQIHTYIIILNEKEKRIHIVGTFLKMKHFGLWLRFHYQNNMQTN